MCVLSGVIFALCYFRVAHIYILVDFLLVGLDIAYIIAIGKFLPKGIANQVIDQCFARYPDFLANVELEAKVIATLQKAEDYILHLKEQHRQHLLETTNSQ